MKAKEINKKIKIDRNDIELIRLVTIYISDNIVKHHTIKQLSQIFHTNQYKLKHHFKSLNHVSLYGFLQQQRLALAKSNLKNTSKSIKVIAIETGFKNANNFSSFFKKKTGVIPTAYRTG